MARLVKVGKLSRAEQKAYDAFLADKKAGALIPHDELWAALSTTQDKQKDSSKRANK